MKEIAVLDKAYKELLKLYKEKTILGNISGILSWDFEVMMPKYGAKQRSEEMALLSGLLHDRATNPKIGKLLKTVQTDKDYAALPQIEKRNIELLRREYDKSTKIPKEHAVALTIHSTVATEKWKEAKRKADYSIFKPYLTEMVALMKKQALYLDPEGDPFDTLLNEAEYGFTTKVYDKLFEDAKKGLIPLIKACLESDNQPDMSLIQRKCPIAIQRELMKELMTILQYDSNFGRIDEAVHPFTSGFYDDVRITVKYDESNFTTAFGSLMHEAGHALYSFNYPREYMYQPIGNSASSATHEGQARFIENIIGLSLEFWEFFLPKFKTITGKLFKDVKLEPFVHALNQVTSSKIRIESDPLTYSMHVIVRYEVEKELFAGKVSIDELPSLWNEKMNDYLGVEVENDGEGLLQDVHWCWALFGYFPTYSLGSYYDEQYLAQMQKDLPEWQDNLRQGKLEPIFNWLNTNIRNKGALLDPLDLVKEVTGEDFTVNYFVKHAKEKYSKLYDF